jgi:multidrug efflux pump subunit AcrB
MCKFMAAVVRLCAKYPAAVPAAGLVITIIAVFMLFSKGTDASGYGSEDSLYAQIEFDGGLLAQEVDRLLADYSEQLLNFHGIKNIETGAKTGSGTLLISFDPKKTKANFVREAAKEIYIPGGFVFFHEDSSDDNYWEIFIYGDDDKKCRELAKELANISAGHPLINDRVLNFKEGREKLTLLPDREILAEAGILFSAAASGVRIGVYGPVAYKRMETGGEIDVRIRTGENVTRQSRDNVFNLLIASGSGEAVSSLKTGSLVSYRDETEPSSIRRDNRRRSASITVSTKRMDARRVKKELSGLFEKIDLPQGYSIEFDNEAIRQSENISATVFSLVMAIIFCYMIIACINESFTIPFLILATVPPSLAFPAICLVLSGSAYNSAVACSFIAVSGMSVNASILCVDSFRFRLERGKIKSAYLIYSAIREKMPALLSTTAATITGALPFIFLAEGANELIKTLSLVGALGVTCSFFCSITVIPSLISIFKFKNINL